MEIYIHGTSLFMIVETPLDFDWDTAMAKMATLPRQEEWENYMSVFQQAEPELLQLKMAVDGSDVPSL